MKSLVVLLAAAAPVSLLALAQSAGPAPATGAPPAAAASPSPTAAANTGPAASSVPLPGLPAGPTLEKSMPLIPETAPFGPAGGHGRKSGKARKAGGAGPNASPGASPHETFDVEQDIRLKIRIREAQTRAANDPSVQADWVAVHDTRTDPARHAALEVYYNHLYSRMVQLDPSIAALANARRQTVLARMVNTRLGEDAPEVNPFATPTPEPEGKNPRYPMSRLCPENALDFTHCPCMLTVPRGERGPTAPSSRG